MNNKITWEYKNYNTKTFSTNDFSKWVKNYEFDKSLPSEQELIELITSNVEDVGFFKDILDWLRKTAPRKIMFFLRELYLCRSATKVGLHSYEKMCELIYKMGFRTSETVENRMILGPKNKWVQEYFKDFS